MKIERAIEILDPEHREHYDGLEEVNEARRMGMEALKMMQRGQIVRPVIRARWEFNYDSGYYYCSNCKAVSPREDQDSEYCDCPAFCHRCGAEMRGGYE